MVECCTSERRMAQFGEALCTGIYVVGSLVTSPFHVTKILPEAALVAEMVPRRPALEWRRTFDTVFVVPIRHSDVSFFRCR